MRLPGTLIAAAALALLAACEKAPSNSSDGLTFVIREDPCARCTIRVDSIAFIGHPDDTLAIGDEHFPAVDSRGRFFMPSMSRGQVHVFRPDGRLESTFGKAGRGPGEFAALDEITVLAGDTLMITGAGQAHIVSPDLVHMRQFARQQGSLGPSGAAVLSDGRVVRAVRLAEFAIHDPMGGEIVTRGLEGVHTVECDECFRLPFASSRPGTFWSYVPAAYLLERHDTNGTLVQRVERAVEWYPDRRARGPHSETELDYIAELARPRITGVREGTGGVLWVHLLQITGAEALNPAELMQHGVDNIAILLPYMRTMIEALDPVSGRAVGKVTLSGAALPVAGDLTAVLVMGDGGLAWKIVRLALP